MITSIKKRDGRIVPFDQEKIEQAIEKSFMASGSQKSQETAQELAGVVVQEIERDENLPAVPSVEQVQDVVERVLIERGFVRSAKSYILYRAERSRVREMNTRLMKIFEDIAYKDAIDSDIKRENANINGDTAAGKLASALGAEKLVILTDIEGLCNDIKIRDVISYLNIEDVKALKDKGTIAGGMIPKVDCCVQAIEEGVTSVNIIDGRKPHSVLYEAFTNEGTGTTIGTAQPSVGIKW